MAYIIIFVKFLNTSSKNIIFDFIEWGYDVPKKYFINISNTILIV